MRTKLSKRGGGDKERTGEGRRGEWGAKKEDLDRSRREAEGGKEGE